MRMYKIPNGYIDLDHVLAVSDLIFWKQGDDTPDDAWFYITLAFREKRKRIGFKYDHVFNHQDQRDLMKYEYEQFLKAWQNK